MLGWINDCVEKLVIQKYGIDAWHKVKERAGCDYKDGGFLKLEQYPDQSTIDLVNAAGELSGLTQAQVFEAFGRFFVPYIIGEGYENLFCRGSTLKVWMMNINSIHQHLQTTFPKKMTMPEFWVEENEDDQTLTLSYFSKRGNYLAPIAVGLVTEVAKFQFDLRITMDRITTQGVDGSRFTSWKIATEDPNDMYKLHTTKKREDVGSKSVDMNASTAFRCPMSGMEIDTKSVPGLVVADTTNSTHHSTRRGNSTASPTSVLNSHHHTKDGCCESTSFSGGGGMPIVLHNNKVQAQRRRRSTLTELIPKQQLNNIDSSFREGGGEGGADGGGGSSVVSSHQASTAWSDDLLLASHMGGSGFGGGVEPGGLSSDATRKLFPYHIILDSEFYITQVGPDIPRVLGTTESILYGYEIDEVFEFVKPKPAKWTRSWLRKLEDQEFILESTLTSSPEEMQFKGTLAPINPGEVILILSPDARNLDDLRHMGLALGDLPAHGGYRDSVFLREHLSRQMNNALKMEKLSKTLQTEKELLESLLPHHAAEELRKGRAVEPMLHNNVTMFFSDIVGFTNICKTISPWLVIHMLNQLYGIMDHLAKKFCLFKVETIGDAYVCCSGLPESDSNHAANVAHFAVAVSQMCGKVLSPLDGSPIQLRIGVHTGACASGIVGVTNPRYCVFGDTVNTTARHESTGEPNRVHCSLTTMIELMQRAPEDFNLISRGLVDMKGKGAQPTYWLEASKENKQTGKRGMKKIDSEIMNKFADVLGNNNEKDDMDMSARHVVASPTRKAPKRGLMSSLSKRLVVSAEDLSFGDDDDDDDDDDETVSTTSSGGTREESGETLSGEYSADFSTSTSATPSRSQLDRLVWQNRQRPRASKERHDADLLQAIDLVEAVMSNRT